MANNKRTFEVDRFLTRELLLRNPDNTAPQPNQVILTDGKGGVYYKYMNGSTNKAGFNRITLPDSNKFVVADLSFNNLNLREGYGIQIAKLNTDTLVFGVSIPKPSTYYQISTPSGVLTADNLTSVLEIDPGFGITVETDNANRLTIAALPAYNNLLVSTPAGFVSSRATQQLSTVAFNAGFGIKLSLNDNTVNIASDAAGYALNRITTQEASTLNFDQPLNTLNLLGLGNIGTSLSSSTLLISSYSFNSLVVPGGGLSARSTQNLTINPGYGISWEQQSDAVAVATSLPSSFQYISTVNGTISTPQSTNTLTVEAQGIDVNVTEPQTLKFTLASTFVRAITMNGRSTIVDNRNLLRLSTSNTGLVVSTATDGTLLLGTTDFNRIDLPGGTSLFTTNPITGAVNQTFRLAGAPGTKITGDATTNTITFQTISTLGIPIVNTSYSYAKIYSTVPAFNTDVTTYPSVTLNSINGGPEATLSLAGVAPVNIQSNTTLSKNLLYVGLDQSTLFTPVKTDFTRLYSTLSTIEKGLVTSTISVNTLSTLILNAGQVNLSSISVGSTLFLSRDSRGSTLVNANTLSSLYVNCGVMTLNAMAASQQAVPLIDMDYLNNRMGINMSGTRPDVTLDVHGIVLAETYATYSDPSLKEFIEPVAITESDLEILRPWRFRWLADQREDIGISATAVERIVPAAVKTGTSGLKMVDYGRLSVISLAALLESNKRITALESTVTGMQCQL